LVEDCGVEVVLVGDSLGMVIQGHETTIPVTLDDICYHGKAVAAGLQNAMLMLDMPFGSLNSPQQAIDNASYLLKQTQAQVVKLEGGQTQLKTVETLAKFGMRPRKCWPPRKISKRPAPTCCCWNACRPSLPPKLPRRWKFP
jgi:3-methyl-2-oxobutanoate hydroxymethyltransferase